MARKLKLEAGDMIASGPWNPNRELSLVDIVVRELEKLNDAGSISPVVYNQAVDLARGQSKVLHNIYSGDASGLQRVVAFILRQVRNRLT